MIFDLVVLAALLISCLIAFLRGFIREVLTILGVIGGAFAAVSIGPKFAPVVKNWLDSHKENPEKTAETADKMAEPKLFGLLPYDTAADLIAYGSVFIIVVILLSIVSHLMSGFARKIGLGAVDRTLGVFFGIARALVLLALPYYVVAVIAGKETMDQWTEGSHSRVYIETTANWIGQFVPKTVTEDFNSAADKASATMTDATRQRLRELNVLGGGEDKPADSTASQPQFQSAAPEPAQPGYESAPREQLENLIRHQEEPLPNE